MSTDALDRLKGRPFNKTQKQEYAKMKSAEAEKAAVTDPRIVSECSRKMREIRNAARARHGLPPED